MSFVERFGLWTAPQREAARALAAEIEARGVEVVRFSFPDQHGDGLRATHPECVPVARAGQE